MEINFWFYFSLPAVCLFHACFRYRSRISRSNKYFGNCTMSSLIAFTHLPEFAGCKYDSIAPMNFVKYFWHELLGPSVDVIHTVI